MQMVDFDLQFDEMGKKPSLQRRRTNIEKRRKSNFDEEKEELEQVEENMKR